MNNNVWYPYSQLKLNEPRYKVVHAQNEFLMLDNGQKLIDGVSSWWAAIHGYNNKEINTAITDQAAKFSHIMLGGLTHDPVENFAEKLVEITPDGLNHVFFSDSGSVAVEVALKMAVQFWSNQGNLNKRKFIALHNAYHGDTYKCMEVGDDPDYQSSYEHVLNKGFYTSIPKGGFEASKEELEIALKELKTILENHATEIAAFIVEPLMQGAGGFQVYSPSYLKEAKKICKSYNVLLIADEVATGFGRLGKLFACNYAEITPDIMVLGKALTGGYIGHAATISTSEIYHSFLGDTYEEAFMHGPTFMGNPLACAVGLKSYEIFERENYLAKVSEIEKTFREYFVGFEHEKILQIRILGCMVCLETKDSNCTKGFKEYAIKNGLWLRPIGRFLYATPPYTISRKSLLKIIDGLKGWFSST